MENLNSNSAFHGLDNHTKTGGGRFPTLPLSGFTFTPNSSTSSSSHLMVPGSPASSVTQTLPRNPRVVPMITRSQSSSNLPENMVENPYDEVGGGFSSRANHKMPKKSCSQWDMVGASGKNNHLQVGKTSDRCELKHLVKEIPALYFYTWVLFSSFCPVSLHLECCVCELHPVLR